MIVSKSKISCQTNRHFCYILINSSYRNTYVGYTTHPLRRIRQHNGEIVGGAQYTSRHGPGWAFAMVLTCSSSTWDNKKALSCEWHMKPHSKADRTKRYSDPIKRRIDLLRKTLIHPKFNDLSIEMYVAQPQFALFESELHDLLQQNRVKLYTSIDDVVNGTFPTTNLMDNFSENEAIQSIQSIQSRSLAPGPVSSVSGAVDAVDGSKLIPLPPPPP